MATNLTDRLQKKIENKQFFDNTLDDFSKTNTHAFLVVGINEKNIFEIFTKMNDMKKLRNHLLDIVKMIDAGKKPLILLNND